MTHVPGARSPSFVLPAGATRRADAVLPFKLLAQDSSGLLSICEFVLPGWASGPVLHRHDHVDEGFFVVSGRLEFQLDDARVQAGAGDFGWVPRGTAHTFACASADPVHVVSFALPGGIEEMFAEQWAHLSTATGPVDPSVLDAIGARYDAPTLGPPITASDAPG